MKNPIKWGILATGYIAQKFADDFSHVQNAELAVVASRTLVAARQFAEKFSIPQAFGSYEQLIEHTDVDVIYVATPHVYHYNLMMKCLDAGKAVLCEKPFTINAGQTHEVIQKAKANKLFLMEGLWTRFQPVAERVNELISNNAIGLPHMMSANLGFRCDASPGGRLLNPELGGGALLDVGIYAINWAYMIFGAPNNIVSLPVMGSTGVDETSAMVLGYDSGQLATLYSTIKVNPPQRAIIVGEAGQIIIDGPLYKPTGLQLVIEGKSTRSIDISFPGHGLHYEANAVTQCIQEGKTECERMPLSETLSIMQTMDTIRQQWNFKYPGE
ncbi:Gfo/Idh/MocA family oxidoreductase [candidate division KSB1 bacterium]|nr:Gfo/Idh/MocA family oxidoreductase [candidate division KSB1 bacterium]